MSRSSRVIGIAEVQRRLKENISWLKQHGYLMRIGPDKGGHWEVVK